MYARANAMGQEARGKGVHVLLAPSVGPLGRSPAGGRNWEGFGSDAYLQGVAAYQSVKVCELIFSIALKGSKFSMLILIFCNFGRGFKMQACSQLSNTLLLTSKSTSVAITGFQTPSRAMWMIVRCTRLTCGHFLRV